MGQLMQISEYKGCTGLDKQTLRHMCLIVCFQLLTTLYVMLINID